MLSTQFIDYLLVEHVPLRLSNVVLDDYWRVYVSYHYQCLGRVEIPSRYVNFEVDSLNRIEVIQVVDNIPDLRP